MLYNTQHWLFGVIMFGLILTCVSLMEDLLWWCTLYRLRQEARKAADRLVRIIRLQQDKERNRGA